MIKNQEQIKVNNQTQEGKSIHSQTNTNNIPIKNKEEQKKYESLFSADKLKTKTKELEKMCKKLNLL